MALSSPRPWSCSAGFFLGVLVCLPALAGSSYTPQERADAVAPATRDACVLLRALGVDGRLSEVCATAEELAPFVAELVSSREASPASSSAPLVAFALPVPPRRVPRRRCAVWVAVGGDAGKDGAP